MITALEVAHEQLAAVVDYMKLDKHVHEILKQPMRQVIVRFPVKMDNGTIRIFEGYRFQHNWALGATRGGTRFHKDETIDDVKALSLWMTIKNSLNEIPNGGAKGGIAVDPATLSTNELERLCRGYVRALSQFIGAWNDFPGGDIGTNMQTQSWMMDELETINKHNEPGGISGKALILGGSEGRPEATSRSILYATREVAKVMGLKMNELTAVVQGFGKVGSHLSKLYQRDGVKVIAVSDVNTGIFNNSGLDILDVNKYVEEKGTVVGYPKATAISNAELLELKCDVLAPCAVQNVITKENAQQVKARIIVEGANGPLTPEAEKILLAKGVIDIPDILSNSGGTQVAHYERVQNLHDNRWTEEEVNAKLEFMIKKVFNEVYTSHKANNITMRMACWVKAVSRVVEAMKYRGMV